MSTLTKGWPKKKQIIHTKTSMNGLMFFYKSYYIRKDVALQEKSGFHVRFSNTKRYCSSRFSLLQWNYQINGG